MHQDMDIIRLEEVSDEDLTLYPYLIIEEPEVYPYAAFRCYRVILFV